VLNYREHRIFEARYLTLGRAQSADQRAQPHPSGAGRKHGSCINVVLNPQAARMRKHDFIILVAGPSVDNLRPRPVDQLFMVTILA
jgi:hypothetical protein